MLDGYPRPQGFTVSSFFAYGHLTVKAFDVQRNSGTIERREKMEKRAGRRWRSRADRRPPRAGVVECGRTRAGQGAAMTEAEWLRCDDAQAMLAFVESGATDRRLRLFVLACCRRLWGDSPDEMTQLALQCAELY